MRQRNLSRRSANAPEQEPKHKPATDAYTDHIWPAPKRSIFVHKQAAMHKYGTLIAFFKIRKNKNLTRENDNGIKKI